MEDSTTAVELATDLTVAWLSNPNTRASAEDVPLFLQSMHDAVSQLTGPKSATTDEMIAEYTPAVSPRISLASPDHIISMIDGKPYKALKRHLSGHGLTPDQYRQRYNLKADYPMVAATYSEARRTMAKAIGLGRKAGQKVETAAEPALKNARKGAKAALSTAKEALGTAAMS